LLFSASQAREFFRFELRLLLRQPTFWIALIACMAGGVGFAATDIGALEVAAGRVQRNVPYAVVRSLSALSALGMFVVLVTVAQSALRDFSSGTAPLVFSRPVRTASYLVGRLAGGYCVAATAVLGGALSLALAQVFLAGSDPQVGPVPWSAWAYGVVVFVLPNLLLLASLIFLIALWTRSMGATFLGVLAIMIGQDIAEVLPIATFGTHLPALLDPLGFAAMDSVTRSWTVSQYASSLPPMGGDLLLNRALWAGLTLLFCGLAGTVFNLRARRADGGQRPGKARSEQDEAPAAVALGLPVVKPKGGAGVQRRQFAAILRFELGRMVSSLAFKVILVSGLALVAFGVLQGERILGVNSLPGSRTIALALGRGAKLTLTLLVVLFSGEVVWRERSTRMDLTLDALPTRVGVTVAGKVAALAVLIVATLTLMGCVAWALQAQESGQAAQAGHVAAAIAHESLGYLQLAAVALLLQTLAGGRMTGYLAMGVVLALRLALRGMGHSGELYSLAGVRMPSFSDMDGLSHAWPRVALVHGYWSSIAITLVLLAWLLWPRGVQLSLGQRLGRAGRRLSRRTALALALVLASNAGLGAWLYRASEAPGAGWSRDRIEAFQVRYEVEFGEWRGRARPQVVSLQADVELENRARRARVRGSYGLVNQHDAPIERMLLSYDPDLELRGLGFSVAEGSSFSERVEGAGFAQGVLPGATDLAGTHVLRFEPPLAPGASIQLDFELEFDPPGLGRRPADAWMRENGSFLLVGTGTHSFFNGAQLFPTLGYDDARELRRTRGRTQRGLEAWDASVSAQDYEQRPDPSGPDWAQVELWLHTDEDQTPLAPGELVEHSLSDGRAHHHYRTRDPIQAFFPIVCGRYAKIVARQGDVQVELYHHPDHTARVEHILWALQRSLAYFEQHWGPYPQGVLRMGEIPGGNTFAASFPGVMGFAEGMSFTCSQGGGHPIEYPPPGSNEASIADMDPILWIVAHEVAHQWWDCHVLPAQARGQSFASESLAQYGSLCVLQEEYGPQAARRMALHNRELYLAGRSRSDRAERTLLDVDEQDHLHYGKGLVAFNALAQLAGRDAVNRVLALIVTEYGGPAGQPLTSIDLVEALKAGLPPEVEATIDELMTGIEFLESSIERAQVEGVGQGFELVVDCAVQAVRADGDGLEEQIDYAGLLELEVLFDEVLVDGGVAPVLLEATVSAGRARFEGVFEQRPTRVRVDPRVLHIDRDLNDNEMTVLELPR